MRILIDLDGTIAKRNTLHFIQKCNNYLDLAQEPEHLGNISWKQWLGLPTVRAYRERVGESAWAWKLRCVMLDPGVQRNMLPMYGAIESVQRLGALGHIAYCTCRKTTFSEEWNAHMAQATKDWLATQGFPNPTDVIFCTTPAEKLRVIAGLLIKSQEPVLLIDDLAQQLLVDTLTLTEQERAVLMEHFTLCVFHAKHVSTTTLFRTVALQYWTQVDELLVDMGLVARI